MFCGLPVEWEKMENSNFYARIRALIYRRIRRHKNPPPKAAMEAREFIHVRLHEEIDTMKKEFTASHFARLADGSCRVEVSPYYSSTLAGLERVADHLINVGYSIVNPIGSQKKI